MGESVNDILGGGRAQPPWLHALPRASVYEPENRKECVGRRKGLEKRQIRQGRCSPSSGQENGKIKV